MKDQRGFTLYELLAAISILFVASALIYGVFFGFNKNYNQISEKNNMDQAANLIISTIKQYHLKYDEYMIDYNAAEQTAKIGVNASEQILGDDRYSLQIMAGSSNPEAFTGEKVIYSNSPLSIQLILKDNTGQTYEIETMIKRY
ncbi:type II secretion system protein [Bacillus sp. ISL-41]|uniref:type II secretion system protein n=1 Tax=Bacillus sp. ISL-41 TaxID=2819127 RepID=UPI001BEBE663|nr:type II secretion system protein [Bacillus sp. ISL-41]MBT2643087.1 type II secretion system protein [Bacillus sp. ISL-41]